MFLLFTLVIDSDALLFRISAAAVPACVSRDRWRLKGRTRSFHSPQRVPSGFHPTTGKSFFQLQFKNKISFFLLVFLSVLFLNTHAQLRSR